MWWLRSSRAQIQTVLCNHHNMGTWTAIVTTNWLSSPAVGIDGPAAFLGSEAPDLGMKIQILSVSQPQSQSQSQPQSQSQSQSQPQSQSQSQSQSPTAEEPERDGDTETLLEPKTDIHELLQKQGESRQSLRLKGLRLRPRMYKTGFSTVWCHLHILYLNEVICIHHAKLALFYANNPHCKKKSIHNHHF